MSRVRTTAGPRSTVRCAGAAALLLLALAGCAGGSPGLPTSPSSSPAAQADAPAADDGAGRARLQNAVDRLMTGAPIVFVPDRPTLVPTASRTITALAGLVAVDPRSAIRLTGYTAPSPGEVAVAAQLARARAETVATALEQAGTPRERLRIVAGGPDGNRPGGGRTVTVSVE